MKKYTLLVLAIVLVLSTVFLGSSFSRATASEPKILAFNTMVGVPAPYTGGDQPHPRRAGRRNSLEDQLGDRRLESQWKAANRCPGPGPGSRSECGQKPHP